MNPEIKQKLNTLEFYGAVTLFFCIPFFKVGKTVGVLMLISGAFGKIIIQKKIQLRKPNTLEIFLIGMLITGFISTILNWPFPKKFNGFKDTLQFVLIFWIIYRNKFDLKKLNLLFWAIVTGSIIGMIWGFIRWKTGETSYLIFKNMSLANTAIIIGIISSSLIGKIVEKKNRLFSKDRISSVLALVILIFCLIMGGNRSGTIGLFSFLITLPFFIKINFKMVIGFTVITLISSFLIWNSKSYSNRITHLLDLKINIFDYESMSHNDQFRFDYWRVSYAQFMQKNKKLFGIGPRNHGSIDVNSLKFNPPLKNINILQSPNHSHNWLLTKLIEEGIIGLLCILGFWLSVILILFKNRNDEKRYHWTYFACFGAIIIPAIAGLFYSPFRREVAWVSMMYIGLALSVIRNNEHIGKVPTNKN